MLRPCGNLNLLFNFRAFIRDRYYEACQGKEVGTTWLFYGCRHEEQDFLYKDEFEKMINCISERGLLMDFKLTTAFSRQGSEKVYVQHRLKEHADAVWDILDQKRGHVYVCGDAKRMASDVNRALEEIAALVGKHSEQTAMKAIKGLRIKGRYQEDVW